MLPITSAAPDFTASNAAGLFDARITTAFLSVPVKKVSGPEFCYGNSNGEAPAVEITSKKSLTNACRPRCPD